MFVNGDEEVGVISCVGGRAADLVTVMCIGNSRVEDECCKRACPAE